MRLPSPFTAILHFENDVWGLRKTIDTLSRQTRPPTAVIVVDDSPQAQAGDKIREAPVSYVRLPMPVGSVVAFHEGARMANTPWLLFVRGNPWFPEHFLDGLDALVSESGADAFVCPISKQTPQSSFAARFAVAWRREAFRSGDPWTPEPAYGACAVRLEAFLESGGFGENMDFEPVPDLMLGENLAQGAFQPVQAASFEVIDSRRFEMRELAARFFVRCRAIGAVRRMGLGEPTRPHPPLRFLPAVLVVLLVVLPPWNGWMLGTGAAAAAWHAWLRRKFLQTIRTDNGLGFALRAGILDLGLSLAGAAGWMLGLLRGSSAASP